MATERSTMRQRVGRWVNRVHPVNELLWEAAGQYFTYGVGRDHAPKAEKLSALARESQRILDSGLRRQQQVNEYTRLASEAVTEFTAQFYDLGLPRLGAGEDLFREGLLRRGRIMSINNPGVIERTLRRIF